MLGTENMINLMAMVCIYMIILRYTKENWSMVLKMDMEYIIIKMEIDSKASFQTILKFFSYFFSYFYNKNIKYVFKKVWIWNIRI